MTIDRAERQRQRNVAPRVLHFARRERDVVPGVGREERPGLRDADGDEQAERRHAPTAPARCRPRRAAVQRSPKLSRHRGGVPAEQQAEPRSAPSSAPVFAVVKMFWMIRPYSRPRVLVHVSSAISSDADELRRRQRQRVAGREMDRRDQVVVVGDPRHEHAEEAREADGDGGDRAGLDDEEQRPAVQKAPQRRERLAQVDVLAAGARHHRRQLAVRQRADDRQHAGDDPADSSQPGLPRLRAMSADTMKMPEPIIEPTTTIVES